MLDRLIWCDVETFGLEPLRHPILEVGFRVTNLQLDEVDRYTGLIWEEGFDFLMHQTQAYEPFVYEMHETSELWKNARENGKTERKVEIEVLAFLESHGVDKTDPLVGSSVGFDKEMLKVHLPLVAVTFSYRVIDTSSVKELCMRYNPSLYATLEAETEPMKRHRVQDDITDSINEFGFYNTHFLRSENA